MSDFLNDTLFPALFSRLDTALPEFNFRSKESGGRRVWVSRTATRPDGTTGKEAGKTYVSERTPFFLSDLNPIRGRSIWGYIKERDGLDNSGTFKTLCELAEVRPERILSENDLQRIEAAQKRAAVFEAANTYLLEQLHSHKSDAAQAAREYLQNRGYTLRELRQPGQEIKDGYTGGERVELGYLPNIPDLEKIMQAGGFSPEEIKNVLPPGGAAGRVSLTLRERGRIVGFKFRSIDGKEPKYLNQSGYQKENYLPGLTRGGEVVLVEGELDSMTAHAAGFLQVAAIGGAALSEKQIDKALRAGVKSITLALDNDEPGQTATRRTVEALLQYHNKSGADFDIFVCQYPTGVKDMEELLRQPGGKQAAEAMLRGRWGAARYLAKWLDGTRAHQIAQEAGGYQSDVFRAELIREAVLVERLARPVDVPQLRQFLQPIYQTYGIEPEAIAAAADSVREMEAAKQYRAELARISQEAAQAAQAGKQEEAERLLWVETREARLKLHAGRFAELLEGHNREEVIKGLNPPALQTSYTMQKKGLEERALELPAGAITVIAAASGHGKTAMLINLILDVCRLHPDKEFHFFSLEESAAAVTAKMLNTFLDLDFSGRNEPALEAYLKGDPRFIKNEYLSELREKEAQFWPLLGKQIFIHYLEQGTAEEFCEAVQWLHRRRNVGAVFADYLQLFGLENRGKLDRQEELKRVCLMLKNTAIETGLPLCFAAQFNREVTTEKKSQEYTKIGEAGDIERVAALILGLWNRSFNPPKKTETDGGEEAPAPADVMAARVLKWRGGPVGYGAAWGWNGNRKRIYPNTTTTTGAAAPGAPGGANFTIKKGKQ